MIKILFPLDFSATSSNALLYALQLFEGSDLEITLLHAYWTSSANMTIKNIDHLIEKDSWHTMKGIVKEYQKDYPDVSLKPKIIKDFPVSAITALGDSGDYDFIVMGTQGASGLKEVFLGSVAGGVISKTSAPVIVVPVGHSFRPLDEIVLALSDTPISESKVADPLRQIASMQQSKIKALHIAENKEDKIGAVLNNIEDMKPSLDYTFGTGNVHEDLNEYLVKNNSGLLCLVRSKKGFFDRIFKESVTLKQTFDSPVPLLILHDII